MKKLFKGGRCNCKKFNGESVRAAFERKDPKIFGKRKVKDPTPQGPPPQRRAVTSIEGLTSLGSLTITGELPKHIIPEIGGREIRTRLTVPTRINFSGRDGTVLDKDDNVNNRTLNAIVKTLQDYPQLKMFMYVNFLTDITARGSFDEERHKLLVSKRAAAMIKFFKSKGIDPTRIKWGFDSKKFETKRRPDNTIRDDQKFILINKED